MSDQAPDYKSLYKFKTVLEAGFEKWLNENAELKLVATAAVPGLPNTEGSSDNFQKPRPRIEAIATPGAAFGHFVIDAEGLRRENGWAANLSLLVITESNAEQHDEYVATIRNLMATGDQVLDEDNLYMPYHEVGRIETAGTEPDITPQNGVYVTKLNYTLNFAVKVTAWPGGLTSA